MEKKTWEVSKGKRRIPGDCPRKRTSDTKKARGMQRFSYKPHNAYLDADTQWANLPKNCRNVKGKYGNFSDL
jgi:hypothetical protein